MTLFGGRFDENKLATNLKASSIRAKCKQRQEVALHLKLKRNIAQSLQQNKELAARIVAEQLIQSEDLVLALDLVKNFCDLLHTLVASLCREAHCPNNLKTPLCSILFAAPKLAVEELTVVSKQLELKYGKPFIAESTRDEQRNVDPKLRMLLSSDRPPERRVLDTMETIAKEFYVEWSSPSPNPISNIPVESFFPDEIDFIPSPQFSVNQNGNGGGGFFVPGIPPLSTVKSARASAMTSSTDPLGAKSTNDDDDILRRLEQLRQ